MKYEEPKMELIELVEREVFMTQSPGIGDGGFGDTGENWGTEAP